MKIIILIFLFIISLFAKSAEIIIKVHSLPGDTLSLFVYPNDAVDDKQNIRLRAVDGRFLFTYNPSEPCVVRIDDGVNIVYGILEDFDKVYLEYDIYNIKHTFKKDGRGSLKFFPDIKGFIHNQVALLTKKENNGSVENIFEQINILEKRFVDSLNEIIPGSSQPNLMLKGYYESITNFLKRRILAKFFPDVPLTVLRNNNIGDYLRKEIEALLTFNDNFHLSPDYINDVYYTLLQEYMTLMLSKRAPGSTKDKYEFYLNFLPEPLVREKVLCLLLSTDFKSLNDTDYLIEFARKQAEKANTPYSLYLTGLTLKYGSLFRKGMHAPNFSLIDVGGNSIYKNDFKGKVVIMDFWYKNCAPCISFFNFIKPLKEEFKDSDVVFLNISIDSYEVWQDALKRYNFSGAHTYTNGKRDTHPIIMDYHVNGYPTVCILDRDGNFFNASPPTGNLDLFRKQILMALKAN